MNEVALILGEAMRGLTAQGIDHAEETMLAQEQAYCPVVHHFGPGVYIREVSMGAGLFAIGHRQTQEHVNIMLKGRVLMLQDDGSTQELVAPLMFTGKPGRKIGYILEDVVWQNVYATECRDIEMLESIFLDKSSAWQDLNAQRIEALRKDRVTDRDDFLRVLSESGFSAEIVQCQSEDVSDQRDMPQGSWKVKTGQSPIQGTGIFLTTHAEEGEVLGPARIQGLRTPLGRYTNHSASPNARMELLPNGDIQLVTTRRIFGCAGGLDGDEVTIDYRQALRLHGITLGEPT
jgi:SET domain